MRLFVAVDLDKGVRDAVGRLIAQMRKASADTVAARIVWVAADRLHLTLHFLANVDALTGARIAESVAAPIGLPAFRITFARIGTFTSRGVPNVIWLGVEDGLEPLRALHSVIGGRLKALGCELEERPFSAHLTLARLRHRSGPGHRDRRCSSRGLAPVLAVGGERQVGSCVVDHVTLYESRLGREGAAHLRIAEGLLSAPGGS
jgi:RNA 2',3'-cyclic 3'-phosphodiesterase